MKLRRLISPTRSRNCFIFFIAALTALAPSAIGQTWSLHGPASRNSHTAVWDSVTSQMIIFGGLESDLANFAALIGLSVSINGGIRRRAPVPVPVADQTGSSALARPRFQPFYQR